MRPSVTIGAAVFSLSGSARATDPPPEPGAPEVRAAPPAYSYEPAPVPPPLGHRGFQMAFRTGAAFPLGSAKDADPEDATLPGGASKLSDLVSLQVPVTLDIGGKPNKFVFIGGYVSFGFGLAAGALSRTCDALDRDCRSASFRIGAQIHYEIAPDDFLNPWLGYGLGYTSLVVGDDGQKTTFRGFDFGHFMAGLDLRISRTVGIGPFVDFTVGKYASRVLETQGRTIDGDIDGRAFHYWVTVGPRFVFLP
jgi:hypothetical protein